jgi:hypothetical protein
LDTSWRRTLKNSQTGTSGERSAGQAITVNKVTPYKDITWYVKWTASFFILIAIVIRAADYSHLLDMVFGIIGMGLWAWVGFMWHDRSIIVLNAISAAILAVGILEYF